MKRYVAKFLKHHRRELRAGTPSQDRRKLNRMAFLDWLIGVHRGAGYRSHLTANPTQRPLMLRSLRVKPPQSKQTRRNYWRHRERVSNA